MEKKKWPWKRRSSERSPGEGESPGSGSQSEKYSDEPALADASSKDSPEITSKASMSCDDELNETVRNLTEKLSAALVNVSAKEDLVKQHSKVAEEAVAGWEKAENEVVALKQQLEAATQQNLSMEVRVSHLDGALKECVRQLRHGREEQEKMISDAVEEKEREWELTRAEFEARILDLQARVEAEAAKTEGPAPVDPQVLLIVDKLDRENLLLKQELVLKCKELEAMKVERDLSTQTAEMASKLQLESIKKVAKLEAECRRLQYQSSGRKSSPGNNPKTVVASCLYAESLTDSHSDSGERLHTPEGEPSFSDSWATALIAELDQFKNDKLVMRTVGASSFEIDMMDDFLEMERLAALPDSKSNTPFTASESASGESICMENPLRAELDLMTQRVAELEKKLEKIEAEKLELEKALDEKQGTLEVAQSRIAEAESKLGEVHKELTSANGSKELLEVQLISLEAETRTLSANIDSLKADIEKERTLSAELTIRCREVEDELMKTAQETEMQQLNMMNSDSQLKIKQEEDLAVASDKLAECQKTIASLGQQLKSLATLEDFLIDTSNIPGFSTGSLVSEPARTSMDSVSCMENGNGEETPSTPSVSALSLHHTTAAKTRNGFGKFFSRSKTVIEVNDHQD